MKDSSIGVMGATFIMSIMLIKTAALLSLAEQDLIGTLIFAVWLADGNDTNDVSPSLCKS